MEERMRQLGELMSKAQAPAQTDVEKRRVGLWHDAPNILQKGIRETTGHLRRRIALRCSQ